MILLTAMIRTGGSSGCRWLVGCLCLATLLSCSHPGDVSGEFPQKPIKVIVPFAAGGGSDSFTRVIQKIISEAQLLEQPLVVVNVPGAGGSIGARRVKNARPDGYTILQLHEGMLTNKYSGNTDFGPESFLPVAGTGQLAHVIAVPSDSPFRDLRDLLAEASGSPDSIVFAVGIGAPSHFAGMMLEHADTEGRAKFRFAQSGGGAKRYASLLGGHSAVTTFSVAEFIEFQSRGIRALGILSRKRSPQVPEVPTAVEQGLEVVSTNMHFWWVPKGTPNERIIKLGDLLESAMETSDAQALLAEMATEPVVLRGADLVTELSAREQRISAVATRSAQPTVDFGLGILVSVLVLGTLVTFSPRGWQRSGAQADHRLELARTAVITALMFSYVLVLQFSRIDYRISTSLFFVAVGLTLAPRNRRLWPTIVLAGVLLSAGLYFLFTRVLIVDLP